MNQATEVQDRTVQDSLQSGHRFVGALSSILEGIVSDLTGYEQADTSAGAAPSCGIVGDASSLANRINGLISVAEQIKERLSTPQVHSIELAQRSAVSGGGLARSNY